MKNYFEGIKTVPELRQRYRALLKMHHPDNNGNEEVMKEINVQYDRLFDVLSQSEAEGKESYTKENDEEFRRILEAISGFNITVEIIGNWIWAFDSFAYKDKLKELGFRYAPRKRAWTWHNGEYRRCYKGEVSLNSIKAKYGCETIKNKKYQYSIN